MILTKYQLSILKNIENRDDFNGFIVAEGQNNVYDVGGVGIPSSTGSGHAPYTVIWNDLAGCENVWKIGVSKIIYTMASECPKSAYPEHVI